MKHYDEFEWELYKKDLLDGELKRSMEEHLFSCEECMDYFLSLIDEEEIDQASRFVPEDFTIKLMDRIDDLDEKSNRIINLDEKRKNKKQVRGLFTNYVAAACLTIALTAGGVFNTGPETIRGYRKTQDRENISSKIYETSVEITGEFSRLLNGF